MSNATIPDVDLDFGTLSDDEFEMAMAGDTSFLGKQDEQDDVRYGYESDEPVSENLTEVEQLERQLEEAKTKAKGIGNAGELKHIPREQTVSGALLALSADEQAKVLKAVNTSGDGSPVLSRFESIGELAEAMKVSSFSGSELDADKDARVREQLHKLGKTPKGEKHTNNLPNRRFRKSSQDNGKSFMEAYSEGQRHRQNRDNFFS
ncbi:hypothetical protein VCRA2110O318_40055 [Vibrio crassostreae]|nr:hypothetical protein VCRA2117O328_40054 [Vibrio crassostreae]CAK2335309.1 hypothetical protein VCRA2110O318_40055 [Vibrio crassostreae]CAK2503735.1 hypothetical protein VCRA2110O319_50055 [Vibrio crassostreae]CAK2910146.1 hypothetical protein VCRA217O317_30238 [Vibrio crassostreae]